MRTILVPVESHDKAETALQLAAVAATRFGSIVEGLAFRSPPRPGFEWDITAAGMIYEPDEPPERTRDAARARFERVMRDQGLTSAGEGASGPSWRWQDRILAGDETLGVLGRAFDLTVVGQPSSDGSAITTLEAALFDSGGPVLIASPRSVATLGDIVVIVWNGSTETARTIGLAKGVLQQASRVVLLSDDGALNHRPSGSMVQQRLKLNKIDSDLIALPKGGIRSGETILREASALGCDLLIKGAYTQSRIRQMIFGGATKHLIENAAVPVMMAH